MTAATAIARRPSSPPTYVSSPDRATRCSVTVMSSLGWYDRRFRRVVDQSKTAPGELTMSMVSSDTLGTSVVDAPRVPRWLTILLISLAGLLLAVGYTRIVSFKLCYYY